jgi:hypothetical protein
MTASLLDAEVERLVNLERGTEDLEEGRLRKEARRYTKPR